MIRPRLLALSWLGAALCCAAIASAGEHDRARDYWHQGELTAATLVLKEHLNKVPDDTEARVLLARVILDLYQAAAARNELLKAQSAGAPSALVLPPLARALLLLGQYQQVLDEVAVAAVADPEDQAALAALRGDAHRGLGDAAAARAEYGRALSLFANQLDAQLGLARLALVEGDIEQARQVLLSTTAQDPSAARAWELLAEVDFAEARYGAAEESLVKAIVAGRNKWMPRFKRSLARLELGKLDAAEADINAVAEDVPSFPGLLFARGALALAQGDLEAGLTSLVHQYENPETVSR